MKDKRVIIFRARSRVAGSACSIPLKEGEIKIFCGEDGEPMHVTLIRDGRIKTYYSAAWFFDAFENVRPEDFVTIPDEELVPSDATLVAAAPAMFRLLMSLLDEFGWESSFRVQVAPVVALADPNATMKCPACRGKETPPPGFGGKCHFCDGKGFVNVADQKSALEGEPIRVEEETHRGFHE